MIIAPHRFKEAVDVFGPILEELYGQSEACFPLLIKSPKDYIDADGNYLEDVAASTGRANHTAWIEIMDDDGNILPNGEKGEIVVRNNGVMKGYYKNPEATAEMAGITQLIWAFEMKMDLFQLLIEKKT